MLDPSPLARLLAGIAADREAGAWRQWAARLAGTKTKATAKARRKRATATK